MGSTPTRGPGQARPPRSPSLTWVAAIGLALLGGVVALLLGVATGALHTSSRTTTVIQSGGNGTRADTRSGGVDWTSLYDRVAPGTVDITSTTAQGQALGSGVVLDGAGHILTAGHVVSGSQRIQVTFLDGATRTAKVLGRDNSADVAVLGVDPSGLTLHPLRLGSSRALQIGDELAVVGAPLGFPHSLSTGVVSGLDRTIQAPNGFTIAHAIQTDAALNPGNSGGPLADTGGRVIGVADQIATGNNQFGGGSETSTGVGFAVPSDLVRSELATLIAGRPVRHAYLGVSTADSTAPGQKGVPIASVESRGPAATAGMTAGDVIVAIDGKPIDNSGDLIATLAEAQPGQQVTVTVQRGSSRQDLTVTLGTQPARAPAGG